MIQNLPELAQVEYDINHHKFDTLFVHFEHIIAFYCAFTPHNIRIQEQVRSAFDLTLLRNMLEHNAVSLNDLHYIVDLLQSTSKQYAMPLRDQEIFNAFAEIKKKSIIPLGEFFKDLILTVDTIQLMLYNDIVEYTNSDRYKLDMEILKSEKGQEWLKKRK
jgi:hypothetical protein